MALSNGFSLAHLPYGSFSIRRDGDDDHSVTDHSVTDHSVTDHSVTDHSVADRRLGVAIGNQIADLRSMSRAGLLTDPAGSLQQPTLNAFMAEGPRRWAEVRADLGVLLADLSTISVHLIDQSSAHMHLAFEVADYVDFYSSIDHATNVGKMFRPDGQALPPNWKHLPIGYHGRAGTIVVSGTNVVRPSGQRKAPTDTLPSFGPSARLDIEAEVGFVVGVPSPQGDSVPTSAFADHVFGVVLVNDWSARDIQTWEYQPLGPFLAKSFATSVSAWVTPLAALAAARSTPPDQDPAVLSHLVDTDPWSLDLRLSVTLNATEVSTPRFATMYWTPGQQLAHMTSNGASLRTGDLFASGTVSGPTKLERGCLLELSWGGAEPITLNDGSTRTFLLDGDQVTIAAEAPGLDGKRINLGAVTGRIYPSR
jgi:fumarylacetoacetase